MSTRCYGGSTLERWYYAYRRGGLDALWADVRSDCGRARVLTPAQRALLLDIQREHPGALAALHASCLDLLALLHSWPGGIGGIRAKH